MILQEMLAQIVALAQREMKCPDGVRWSELGLRHPATCSCGDTGKVPDPRFKGLVEALTEECPTCTEGFVSVCTLKKWVRKKHDKCKGTGRVLRSWKDQPQGALRGALYKAGYKANLWANESWDAPLKRIFLPLYDVEAVEVVLEALQQEATHAAE